jgi:hypothetical protein
MGKFGVRQPLKDLVKVKCCLFIGQVRTGYANFSPRRRGDLLASSPEPEIKVNNEIEYVRPGRRLGERAELRENLCTT